MCGTVVAMHSASGQYLASGGLWTPRAEDAVEFASTTDAARFLVRHACEPAAWQVLAGQREGDIQGDIQGEGDAAA